MSDPDAIGQLCSFIEHLARQMDAPPETSESDAIVDRDKLHTFARRLADLEWSTGTQPTQEVFGPDDPPQKYPVPGPPTLRPVSGSPEPLAVPHRTNRCVEALGAWKDYATELEGLLAKILGSTGIGSTYEDYFEQIKNTPRIKAQEES
jgi:hypothetical protein